MSAHTDTLPAATAATPAAPAQRKKLFLLLGSAIAVAALGYGSYWALVASHYVSTDNAYVATEIAQVTPEVSGTVRSVTVVDTQHVKKGDVLLQLDDKDARLALAQAEADLARAQRRVQGYFANDESLTAQVQSRLAEQARAAAQLVSARSDLERSRLDYSRRQALARNGSVSGEELS
uniref:biotin/lipoyl-binding protein n=1 Tax=Aquitalea sp. ASV15 TaxID=2795104 RepID=UPI0018ECE435